MQKILKLEGGEGHANIRAEVQYPSTMIQSAAATADYLLTYAFLNGPRCHPVQYQIGKQRLTI